MNDAQIIYANLRSYEIKLLDWCYTPHQHTSVSCKGGCTHNFIQAGGLHGHFRTSEQSGQPHAAPSRGGRGGGAGQRRGELIWKKLDLHCISSKSWVRRSQTMVVTLIKLWESECKISNPGSITPLHPDSHLVTIHVLEDVKRSLEEKYF